MPPTSTYLSLFFWYWLVALIGAYTGVLVPGDALIRYQTPYLRAPLSKVLAAVAAGTWSRPLSRFFSSVGFLAASSFRNSHGAVHGGMVAVEGSGVKDA